MSVFGDSIDHSLPIKILNQSRIKKNLLILITYFILKVF